jgi:hypothetical protein
MAARIALAGRTDVLPPFKLGAYLSLIVPPALAGTLIPSIPMGLLVYGIYFMFNGWSSLYGATYEGLWLLDPILSNYMDLKVDPRNIEATRTGRMGLSFLVLGVYLMVLGARIFVPRKISKHERAVDRRRDARELSRNVWTPTAWRRTHHLLVSIYYSFLLLFIIQLSFWADFGTYIWYFIVTLKIVNILGDMALEAVLRESLLVSPLSAAMAITQGMVTLGASDFQDFVTGFAMDLALGMGEAVYLGPVLDSLVEGAVGRVQAASAWVRRKLSRKRNVSLAAELEAESRAHDAAAKASVGAGVALPAELAEADGGAVEDILGAMQGYTVGVVSVVHAPILIYFFILFRKEVGIPDTYGIRATDMEYYLWFQIILLAFQFVMDQFINSSLETFRGLKIFEYLVYARYRFLKREARWKGMERHLDECIEEVHRTLDQMCFSSQYYFIVYTHMQGMFFFMMAVVMICNANYNAFGDPALPILLPLVGLLCYVAQRLSLMLGDRLGLWQIQDRSTGWHSNLGDGKDDAFAVPDFEELENLKKTAAAASTEHYIMNQKITSDTFRYKFLDYNRLWLVDKLNAVFTPRTLRRSRPYLLAQLAKLLGGSGAGAGADVSDDEDGDGGGGGGRAGDVTESLGPVVVSPSTKAVARWWLASARRRTRLREAVAGVIAAAKRPECEGCFSRAGLRVECVVPLEALGDRFEQEHPNMEEFDVAAWRTFFAKHERFRTLCASCVARRVAAAKARAAGVAAAAADHEDELRAAAAAPSVLAGRGDPRFGPVFLSPASAAIARGWYGRAKRRLGVTAATGAPPRAPRDVSDDDEDNGAGGPSRQEAPRAAWARRPLLVSSATRAIARRWLQLARFQKSIQGVRPDDLPRVTALELEQQAAARAATAAAARAQTGQPAPTAPPPARLPLDRSR